MNNEIKTIEELNNQFKEFLNTKGITAKFKLAFANMKDSAKNQHKKDVENFNSIKEKSIEENKDFYNFLHTKGLKAKVKLVIENIKKGIKEAPQNTAKQIANAKVYNPHIKQPVTAELLKTQFDEFLKTKGLDGKFVVKISEK